MIVVKYKLIGDLYWSFSSGLFKKKLYGWLLKVGKRPKINIIWMHFKCIQKIESDTKWHGLNSGSEEPDVKKAGV